MVTSGYGRCEDSEILFVFGVLAEVFQVLDNRISAVSASILRMRLFQPAKVFVDFMT
jgi:hypothetical protein